MHLIELNQTNANESENDEDYYFNNKTLAIYSVIFIR